MRSASPRQRRHITPTPHAIHSQVIVTGGCYEVTITTNAIDGIYSILERGVYGVYHHWSKEHLHRYLAEFDFRYNFRKLTDRDRSVPALNGAEGKRLMYRDSCGKRN
jgi:hypothetical protein